MIITLIRPMERKGVYTKVLEYICGTPIFNKGTESAMLSFLYPLSKHRCMGNAMKIPLLLPKWFSTFYRVMDIMLRLSLGRIYPEICVYRHFPFHCSV